MKGEKMKNKGFVYCFILYIIMFGLDLFTTLLNGDLVQYLEANPLYNYGGLLLPIALNVVMIVLFYWWYNKSKNPTNRFIIISYMVFIILIRMIVSYSNYQTSLDPIDIETAKQITTEMKNTHLVKTLLPLLLPIIPTYLTFGIWKVDHKIEVKE